MPDKGERLQAFCSVTFDNAFVIRDIKIIEGAKGCFVAMPSRKLTDRCPKCGSKNHLRARYCSHCGQRLDENRAGRDGAGRSRLHADIAHPINSQCREEIQARVLAAYQQELTESAQPGYKPKSLDDVDTPYGAEPKPTDRQEPKPSAPPARKPTSLDEVYVDYGAETEATDRHEREDSTQPGYAPASFDAADTDYDADAEPVGFDEVIRRLEQDDESRQAEARARRHRDDRREGPGATPPRRRAERAPEPEAGRSRDADRAGKAREPKPEPVRRQDADQARPTRERQPDRDAPDAQADRALEQDTDTPEPEDDSRHAFGAGIL